MRDISIVNIIHRDLKLANILLHFPNEDLLSMPKEARTNFIKKANLKNIAFEVKISDFGFAKIIHPDKRWVNKTICGTPAYMAPDLVLNKNTNYSEKVDVWALGAIYYELLIGQPPFYEKTYEAFRNKMNEGDYTFPPNIKITPESMLLISKCMQYDEEHRAEIYEIFEDPYVTSKL